jgi:hypothetical protein
MSIENTHILAILGWINQEKPIANGLIPWDALRALAKKPAIELTQIRLPRRTSQQRIHVSPLDLVLLDLAKITDKDVRKDGCEVVDLLVRGGLDANRFNGIATPVGMADYTGQLDVLRVFHERGADLKLTLSMEFSNSSGLGNTTFLHRIGLRHENLKPSAWVPMV